MLCVCERVIDPIFENFSIHLDLVLLWLEAGTGSTSAYADSLKFISIDSRDFSLLLLVTTVVVISRP